MCVCSVGLLKVYSVKNIGILALLRRFSYLVQLRADRWCKRHGTGKSNMPAKSFGHL